MRAMTLGHQHEYEVIELHGLNGLHELNELTGEGRDADELHGLNGLDDEGTARD
jgi:hypothetical protein